MECLFPRAEPVGRSDRFALYRQPGWLVGVGSRTVDGDIEAATDELYRDMMVAARGRHLARIWNYVPAINATGPTGLENYRAFCRGRSLAYEREFGGDFRRHASAGSGVGCEGDRLAVVFAACEAGVSHVENPRQVPAYDYPLQYGPRPPTFARATVVEESDRRIVFISGTSAIHGHATVAPGDTESQLRCTLENLREIGRACGLGSDLGGTSLSRSHVRVYLRRAADQPAVAALMESAWLGGPHRISYLKADICRRELNVEIEATLEFGAA